MDLSDIPILTLWAALLFVVWSGLALAVTGAVLAIPALFGLWRIARACAVLLAIGFGCLWILSLVGVPTGLPLPTRPRAGQIVWPICAFWPALFAVLISRFRLTSPDVG